jgi:hypothetical protein
MRIYRPSTAKSGGTLPMIMQACKPAGRMKVTWLLATLL